jgi:hypothetical protein
VWGRRFTCAAFVCGGVSTHQLLQEARRQALARGCAEGFPTRGARPWLPEHDVHQLRRATRRRLGRLREQPGEQQPGVVHHLPAGRPTHARFSGGLREG